VGVVFELVEVVEVFVGGDVCVVYVGELCGEC